MRFNESQHSWARMMWNALADRGYWGVPRSGLVFQKQGDKLVLTDRLPEASQAEQNDDLRGIRQLFSDIGVEVTDATVEA